MRTLEQLEIDLRGDARAVLEDDRLVSIRRAGGRRRRGRRTTIVGGALVVVATLAGIAAGGRGDVAQEQSPANQTEATETQTSQNRATDPAEPTELSRLAKRALAEIPGAKQVSDWQVLLPAPEATSMLEEQIPDERVVSERVDLAAGSYTDPTMFPPGTFPNWLSEGGPGILVDHGTAELACVLPRPDNGEFPEDVCRATLLTVSGGVTTLRVSLGTDTFLRTGAPMEVFLEDDFSTGDPTQLAVAGMDGTDVVRADFISADGTLTEGTVLSGNVMENDTLMFANVPGELAAVITYDANGEVVENHQLSPCDSPEDCEVR